MDSMNPIFPDLCWEKRYVGKGFDFIVIVFDLVIPIQEMSSPPEQHGHNNVAVNNLEHSHDLRRFLQSVSGSLALETSYMGPAAHVQTWLGYCLQRPAQGTRCHF
jgi:hypothetical protein